MGGARRRIGGLTLATLLVTAPIAGSAGASTPGRAPLGAGARCAWPVRADLATMNIAYPDAAATYWVQRYSLAPGSSIEVDWRRPHARYSSLVTYGPDGTAIGSMSDRAAGLERARRTRVSVVAGATADGRHLSAGAPSAGRVEGALIYRVYVPDRGRDRRGGTSLPRLTLRAPGARAERLDPCPRPGPSPDATAAVDRLAARPATAVPAVPVFIRPREDGGNLYPNPDNAYLATLASARRGQVLVVRGRAPGFPDTERGRRPTGREQVRYWSFCTNEYARPYRATACAHDAAFPIDGNGDYTLVVSRRADRPANARRIDGVVWLPWGDPAVPMLLLMRNLLADPADPHAAARVAPGAPAASTMGPYAPRAQWCTTARFERGGPPACGG